MPDPAPQALTWLRKNLLVLLFSVLILLQFLTWRASERAAEVANQAANLVGAYACGRDFDRPCFVNVIKMP